MEYLTCILRYAVTRCERLKSILQTGAGWICSVCMFMINFFAGYESAILATVVCVALDTGWGISAQVKQGRFALSELGRKGMLSKIALYASVIIAFIHIERFTGLESHISVDIICALICVVEVWSMCGSALIINPNMPFLRLFHTILRGEIARKMKIQETELDNMLKKAHDETEDTTNPG